MSPLGGAIVALALTIIIGYVVGQIVVALAIVVGSILGVADLPIAAAIVFFGGWILGICVWLTTIILMIFRIIDLVAVAT